MVFLSALSTGVANTAGALAGERRAGVPCRWCLGYPLVPHPMSSHHPLAMQGGVWHPSGGSNSVRSVWWRHTSTLSRERTELRSAVFTAL